MLRLLRLLSLVTFVYIPALNAQVVGTGIYPFGSYDSKGFDTINLGNLNTHFEIPIINKPGRGMPFKYSIPYDGLVWQSVPTSGNSYWSPVNALFGFQGLTSENSSGTGLTGYVYYSTEDVGSCPEYTPFEYEPEYLNYNYVYVDNLGAAHPIDFQETNCTVPATTTGSGYATDGSGYRYNGLDIYDKSGRMIQISAALEGSPSLSITDTNGNQITSNGNGTFTDTLGVIALSITGSGTASSPLNISYPVSEQSDSATTATATVYFKTYTVQTDFQCSGISEYGPVSYDLVDHITLGDGTSTYSFSYETTPGSSTSVTGRMAQITLPTGGTIGYQYSAGCVGNINGDGTPVTMLRSTNDGSTTYNHDINSSHYPTSINRVWNSTGDETDLTFIPGVNGLLYETARTVWQGPVSANRQLQASNINYNGNTPNTTILTAPITQTWAAQTLNALEPVTVKSDFDSSGNLLDSATMSGSSTVQSSAYTYDSSSNLLTAQTTDGLSGNLISSVSYGYDETTPTATSGIVQHVGTYATRGNQTSTSTWIGGSNYLNITTSYYDTGAVKSTTGLTGTTTFAYDPTQTFVTQVTLPTPSSGVANATSATYDSSSGVQLSTTGANSGQTITYGQYDRFLRPTKVTTPSPDNGVSQTTYSSNQISQTVKINSSQSSDQETFLDAYGRVRRTSVSNGTNWNVTDTCYDTDGRIQYVSVTYLSSSQDPSGNHCSAATAVQYAYDGLDRKTSISRPDGSSVAYSYTGRAIESVASSGSTISKIVQYDALGRIANVCELSSGSGTTTSGCGVDITGQGFPSTYSYNYGSPGTLTTTVVQGAQTRVFQTDPIGRQVSTTEPESGTATYTYAYNATGLQVVRTRPPANVPVGTPSSQVIPTSTTYQYDTLNRILSQTYNDGTPTKSFIYDVNGFANQTTYPIGQMTQFLTTNSDGSNAHTRLYIYDIMGRVSGTDDCLPDWCVSPYNPNYNVFRWYSYNSASMLASEQYSSAANNGSLIALNYSYNNAGQLTSISGGQNNASLSPSIYSATAFAPGGATSAQYGNGLSNPVQYDTMNRLSGAQICSGSTQSLCTGGALVYGFSTTAKGNQITSMVDTVLGEASNLGYDEFGRLSSQTYSAGGTDRSLTFVYDRYGNRAQQNVISGSGPQPQLSFNTANNQITTGYVYDLAGNVYSDGAHTYKYDAENNLISVDDGSTASFVYDAMNERVKTLTPQGVERYGFDLAGRRVTSWNNSGTLDMAQYYQSGVPIAYYLASDGNIHFEHQDWLGTERARTGPTGTLEGAYSSLPFGDGFAATGTDTNSAHFALLDHDLSASSGLEHATFREYGSSAGRWMSPDADTGSYSWRNPQSFNRYAYVLNQAASTLDPRGLECVGWEDQYGNCWTLGSTGIYDGLSGGYASVGADTGPDDVGYIYGGTINPVSGAGGGGGAGTGTGLAPSNACSSALKAANRSAAGVARANAAWSVLQTAANANGIPTSLLAAIAVRESNFMNVQETLVGGGPGPGMGVFQLTNQRGVSSAQAFNIPFAANYAAGMLSSNMTYLSGAFSFTPSQLLQATAASYNFGVSNISGNPNTIDVGTTGGNYGSTVVGMMSCFSHP